MDNILAKYAAETCFDVKQLFCYFSLIEHGGQFAYRFNLKKIYS